MSERHIGSHLRTWNRKWKPSRKHAAVIARKKVNKQVDAGLRQAVHEWCSLATNLTLGLSETRDAA